MATASNQGEIHIFPATPERWADLAALFGPRGACAGCWCMWFRLSRKQFAQRQGEANREALRDLVESDTPPGLLAYVGGEPAGWCAVAPRSSYPTLARSRLLAPVDDTPVWSAVCFFIAKRFRGRGLTVALLRAAVAFARERGATAVEGYPVEPRQDRLPPAFAYHGLAAAFRQAGFKEVARRSPTRPIMRFLRGDG